jgi:hypothetical protein
MMKIYLFAVVLLLISTFSFSQEEKEKLKAQVNFGFGTKLNFNKYQIDEKLSPHDLKIDPYFFTTSLGLQLSKGDFSAQLSGGYSSSSFSKKSNGSQWTGMIIDLDMRYHLFDIIEIGATVQSETTSLTLYSRSESTMDISQSFSSSSVQLGNSFWSVGPMISTDLSFMRITVCYLFNIHSGDWTPFYNDLPSNKISERGVSQLYTKFEFPLFKTHRSKMKCEID